MINDVAEQEDVEMVDATEVDKAAEGTGFSAAAPALKGPQTIHLWHQEKKHRRGGD